MVRRFASPDFTMTLLLVTAISVALRLRSPMQKNIAPSIKHMRATQYMTPRGVATLAPCQLEGEVTKNAIAMNARTAAIRAWPNITIQCSRVSYWIVMLGHALIAAVLAFI